MKWRRKDKTVKAFLWDGNLDVALRLGMETPHNFSVVHVDDFVHATNSISMITTHVFKKGDGWETVKEYKVLNPGNYRIMVGNWKASPGDYLVFYRGKVEVVDRFDFESKYEKVSDYKDVLLQKYRTIPVELEAVWWGEDATADETIEVIEFTDGKYVPGYEDEEWGDGPMTIYLGDRTLVPDHYIVRWPHGYIQMLGKDEFEKWFELIEGSD